MPKATCPVCGGSGTDPEYGNDPLVMETCPKCYGLGDIKLTDAQGRVLSAAKEINDWFIASDIECQERTIDALEKYGLLEAHWPSGGPIEYRAI